VFFCGFSISSIGIFQKGHVKIGVVGSGKYQTITISWTSETGVIFAAPFIAISTVLIIINLNVLKRIEN
jgi:hypothetical protein